MAASFIQFCATCENQITIPNNAILYCSTRCRNADSLKPISLSLHALSSFTSYSKLIIPPYQHIPTSAPSPKPKRARMTTPHDIPPIRISPPPSAQRSEPHKLTVSGNFTTPASTSDNEMPPPKAPTATRAKRNIESTAAYRFLLQFQRNAAMYRRDPDSTPASSIQSPTLTGISSESDDGHSSVKDVSSLPSLSSSAATVSASGSLETNCSVPLAVMGKAGENKVEQPRIKSV